jgi:hypothetical protein
MKVSVKKLKHIIKEEMKKMGAITVDPLKAEMAIKALAAEEIKSLVLSDPDLTSQLAVKLTATSEGEPE